jgi:hypothetical protein
VLRRNDLLKSLYKIALLFMRILIILLISLFLFSCKKSADDSTIKLLRTEATDNYDSVLHTEYNYDNNNRIIAIKQFKNNDEPVVAVTITYNGNEVVLISHPDIEPAYDETTEVHLSLDENGKLLKRIEYTYEVEKVFSAKPSEIFRYDTLLCEYDAAGLLRTTNESRYDSIYVDATHNSFSHLTSEANYTNDGNNLTVIDEHANYPGMIRADGVTTNSGGSSDYHNVFSYSKSFPNHTDFKNAAVLNEYKLYYEPPFNSNYKNMPDQITRSSTDKDLNGAVIFSNTTTINIERTYNDAALLSAINITSFNTPYKLINYFYGR